MSSDVSAEAAQENFTVICCTVSATTLLVYEYLITFDREYQLVWKRRFSAATLFFLMTRYVMLLCWIFTLPTIYPLRPKTCSAMIWLQTIFGDFMPALSAAFSCLRVYALSGRQWRMASLILILSLVPSGFDIFQAARLVVVEAPPPYNCTSYNNISDEVYTILAYLSSATVVVADVLVLAVTVMKTYQVRKIAQEANLPTSLNSLLLRDGTLYFAVLLILNVLYIVSQAVPVASENWLPFISWFIDPMSAILISRFLLNLREIDSPGHISTDATRPSFVRSQEHSLRFAAFVEPLGAPLDHEFSLSSQELDFSDEGQADEEITLEEMSSNVKRDVSDDTMTFGSSGPDTGLPRMQEELRSRSPVFV